MKLNLPPSCCPARSALALAWCAALSVFSASARAENTDPLEGFNRSMFAVHEGIDHAVMKPLAQGYDAAVPLPAKMSVGNFYSNLWEVSRSGNAFLQGKGSNGLTGLGRLLINSTVGIFGLFDVASELGLEEGNEDFGQTLAVWGVPDGPYLFLPVLGPNNARDLVGWGVDQYTYPLWQQVEDKPVLRNSLGVLSFVKTRANLLPVDTVIDEAALDRYAYIRSAYQQRRAALINDGVPPRPVEDDDDYNNNR
ncbi:MAG: VacJ family lipoprotein [Zoogloeaceae bacterium]|jgi:phospholipid-binding lipoprotein MlaA|nr:VacJ family lipoprotein [Zoogloeaceae bacterium]